MLVLVVSISLLVLDQRFQHLRQLRAALAFVTYPLHYMADLPLTASDWLSEITRSRRELLADRELLQEDNLKLRAELQKFESLRAENTRLRDLLDSSFKVGDRVLIAELSSVDLDPYRQQVVIKKGSASGVFLGQPVLDAQAVMGQVVHLTPFTATVLLITDSSHALPVQVLRNGLRTIAVGSGRINELTLPYLPINSDIRVGDLLVTSGLGGKFPPGYPVATITHIEHSPDNPFSDVIAAPRAHLDRSREVLLVWTVAPTGADGGSPAEQPATPEAPPGEPAPGSGTIEPAGTATTTAPEQGA